MKSLSILERYLKALSYVKRLHILLFLKKNEATTVNEIADAIKMKKFATSQHLRILKHLDIIKSRKKGSFVTYRLNQKQPDVVKKVLNLL